MESLGIGSLNQSEILELTRPKYPEEMINKILEVSKEKNLVLDVPTNNGRLAFTLSKHFKKVIGTDLSLLDIDIKKKEKTKEFDNITFQVCSFYELHTLFAEKEKADLITISQALHWFNPAKLFHSVLQVLNPGGKVILIGHHLLEVEEKEQQQILSNFYDTIKPYLEYDKVTLESQKDEKIPEFQNEEKFSCTEKLELSVDRLTKYLDNLSAYQFFNNKKSEKKGYVDPMEILKTAFEDLNIEKVNAKVKFFMRILSN